MRRRTKRRLKRRVKRWARRAVPALALVAVIAVVVVVVVSAQPSPHGSIPAPTTPSATTPAASPLVGLTSEFRARFTTVPSAPTWQAGYAPPASSGDTSAGLDGIRLTSEGADYFWTEQTAVKAASLTLFFEGDQAGDANGATLALSQRTGSSAVGPDGVFTNSVHVAIRRAEVTVGVYDGVSLHTVGTVPLGLDAGATFTVTVVHSGPDEVTVWVPEAGVAQRVQSPLLRDAWGSTVGVEHYQPEGVPASTKPVLTGVAVYR